MSDEPDIYDKVDELELSVAVLKRLVGELVERVRQLERELGGSHDRPEA